MISTDAETDYILLVEDNPDDQLLFLKAFGKYQTIDKVKIVSDGVEAIEFITARSGEKTLPRLIILDINLPRKSGLEVLRKLRSDANTKYLPVVILTSSDESRDVITSYELCANSYIQKPVNYEAYALVVRGISNYWMEINQPLNN